MINPTNANTWVASDHHFNHARIGEFEPLRNIWKDLGFSSMEEMLIVNHNSVVKPDDTVLFLGDFSWNDPQCWIHRLNGRKFLVLGNHDRKGDTSYSGFEHVFRGLYIGNDMELFKSDTYLDPLLSAVCVRWDNKILLFSHYAVGYDDVYDHQKEGGVNYIELRKKKILEVVNSYNTKNAEIINIHGHLHSHIAVDSKEKGIRYKNACLEHSMFYPQKLRDIL